MTQSDLARFSTTGDGGSDDGSNAADAAEAIAGDNGGLVSEVVDIDDARFPDADERVEVTITQIDYSIEGTGRDEHPVIHVFGRNETGAVEHVRVLGFEPYFYTPTDSLSVDPVDEYDVVLDARETDVDGEPFESIRGEKLTKIVARTPRDVGQIREDFEHYEADILFPNRFLIDKGLGGGMSVPARRLDDGDETIQIPHSEVEPASVDADIRVNTFDIEVDDRNGFPEDGEEPIVCITSHDSFDDQYVAWLYEAPIGDGAVPDRLTAYEPLRADTEIEVRSFDTEAAMLDAFVEYIEQTDPDLLTGWNFEDFDAPYLLDRMERLDSRTDRDLSIERLSRIDEVWRSGWGGPDVKGRVVFDLLYAYKRTQFTELESYRLDAVGELELDVGKERYAGDIGDLWEEDPTRLLEYNVRDVELCVEIDRKQSIVAFWDEVRKFVGCKI
ncbi:MAG: 3'-5' exonuclease, partial [Halobacteriota archaeon]